MGREIGYEGSKAVITTANATRINVENAASAIYLTNWKNGSITLPSSPRPAAQSMNCSKNVNTASDILFHVGGNYLNANKKPAIAASEGCFGIVNKDNSPRNPSNIETNLVISTIFDQANKSQTNPGLIKIVVDVRHVLLSPKKVTS